MDTTVCTTQHSFLQLHLCILQCYMPKHKQHCNPSNLSYHDAMSRSHFLQEIITRERKIITAWLLKINTLENQERMASLEWIYGWQNDRSNSIKMKSLQIAYFTCHLLPSPCCYLIPSCTDHDHITLQRRSETIGTIADTMNTTFFLRLRFFCAKNMCL